MKSGWDIAKKKVNECYEGKLYVIQYFIYNMNAHINRRFRYIDPKFKCKTKDCFDWGEWTKIKTKLALKRFGTYQRDYKKCMNTISRMRSAIMCTGCD